MKSQTPTHTYTYTYTLVLVLVLALATLFVENEFRAVNANLVFHE